jgi:hypothetical protein
MGDQREHEPQRDVPPGMAEQLDLAHAGLVSFGHRPFLTEVQQPRRRDAAGATPGPPAQRP